MTETNLWIFAGAWAFVVSLPLLQKLWFKYTTWVVKNFGDKE